MADVFFFGTLLDPELSGIVIGRQISMSPAKLIGYECLKVAGEDFPMIVAEAGAVVEGALFEGITDVELERIQHYECDIDFRPENVEVETSRGTKDALAYFNIRDGVASDGPWTLVSWQEEYGPLMREAAKEAMLYFGRFSGEELDRRWQVIQVRAQARLNAKAGPSPVELRRGYTEKDVEIVNSDRPYSEFFALDELVLRFRKFSGEMSDEVGRAVFVAADAVTVLPYDPVHDLVLLIEQFRTSLLARGDVNPWSIEAVAGRIDPGETAEVAARREAEEEADLTLTELHKISSYYVSPGAQTEYLFSYVGIADLVGRTESVGGLETEAEDIRSIVISFDRLMAAVDSGEVENSPLILSAFWLDRHRDALRRAAASTRG